MNLTALTATELAAIIAFIVIVVAGIATLLFLRKRRTERLRSKFGGAEYARAVKEGGKRRHAEAGLEKRTERLESFHVRPLAPALQNRGAVSRLDLWTAQPARWRKPTNCWVM